MVSPAVPSFGAPLPTVSSKPANVQIQGKTNKKSTNSAVNALGLTPASLGYETSSEEEDDVDEETKLASAAINAPSNPQVLSISYRGRTHVLRSAEDFASWVEERRKRYPTKAKVEAAAEERRKNGCSSNGPKKGRNAAERKIPLSKRRPENQDEEKGPDDVRRNDSAAKARLKVEKLRQRLEKAEAKARDAGKQPATLQRNNVKIEPGDPTIPELKAPVDRSATLLRAATRMKLLTRGPLRGVIRRAVLYREGSIHGQSAICSGAPAGASSDMDANTRMIFLSGTMTQRPQEEVDEKGPREVLEELACTKE
ncbi:MAG: hypothetical protein OHK93_002581 [Ramalina farinacea]|uniref:FMR1-interacting protein 1 conserved domain-containing protein n=1 Tax=Ramalina farinacea TaxID=258253 RepID=A0AA43U0H6_9LECA|nr:hypothetical protein [Ramalina farinacea]